jgi:uncharacterized repeat protein (TIGR02543 family)
MGAMKKKSILKVAGIVVLTAIFCMGCGDKSTDGEETGGSYTITFDANGGEVSPDPVVTGEDGKLASLPEPEREGYTFDGWFTAETGGDTVTTGTVFNKNTTVYAHWTVDTYVITFNANGGVVSTSDGATDDDGKLASLPTPTREGCVFDGWFTAAIGGEAVTDSEVFSANTTIYAHWTEIPDPATPGFAMMRIEGGTFTMGAPEAEANKREQESPQRQVTLTGFWMSKYQITQGLYREVMGVNPSYFQGEKLDERLSDGEVVNSDNLPVESIRWYDAVVFCNRLSILHNFSPAYDIDSVNQDPNNYSTRPGDPKWIVRIISGANGYRLPTEAQWEYAARAGTTGRWYTGEPVTLEQANYNGLTEHTSDGGTPGNLNRTTEVGSYPPNAWGLHDMYGNVYEFCWDWIWDFVSFDPVLAEDDPIYETTYANAYELYPDPTDPQGMPRGDRKAERGGTYHHSQTEASSTWRERVRPERVLDDLGFRVVRP